MTLQIYGGFFILANFFDTFFDIFFKKNVAHINNNPYLCSVKQKTKQIMLHIQASTYYAIADAIVTALVPEKDYCGSIDLDGETSDGVDYHFAGAFRGYARDGELSLIVPIWWELHTYDNEGDEILNDASFDEIRRSFLF